MATETELTDGRAASLDSPAARCRVRLARPDDEDAIATLLSASFPQWPKIDTDVSPIEHLRWKLAEPQPPSVVIGEVDGGIVGMSIRSLRPAKVGQHELLLQHGFDSCVHPAYRRSGVLSALRGSFGNLLPTRGDLLFFLSKHLAFGHVRRSEGATPLGTSLQVLSYSTPLNDAPSSRTSLTVDSAARLDERFDDFWEQASMPFDFIIARRHDFLNWRYCDRRAGSFVIRTAEDNGMLLGYAVLQVSNGIGYIADLLALPGRMDVAESIVCDALAFFGGRQVSSVLCWSSKRHPYAPLLASLGFTTKRRTLRVHWVAFTDKPDQALLSDRRLVIHYMPGDSDLV